MQTITTLAAHPQSHLEVADNLPWPQHATTEGDPISKGATTGMSEDSPANRPVHMPMTSTNSTAPHLTYINIIQDRTFRPRQNPL